MSKSHKKYISRRNKNKLTKKKRGGMNNNSESNQNTKNTTAARKRHRLILDDLQLRKQTYSNVPDYFNHNKNLRMLANAASVVSPLSPSPSPSSSTQSNKRKFSSSLTQSNKRKFSSSSMQSNKRKFSSSKQSKKHKRRKTKEEIIKNLENKIYNKQGNPVSAKSLSRIISLTDTNNYMDVEDPNKVQQHYDEWRLNEAENRKTKRRFKKISQDKIARRTSGGMKKSEENNNDIINTDYDYFHDFLDDAPNYTSSINRSPPHSPEKYITETEIISPSPKRRVLTIEESEVDPKNIFPPLQDIAGEAADSIALPIIFDNPRKRILSPASPASPAALATPAAPALKKKVRHIGLRGIGSRDIRHIGIIEELGNIITNTSGKPVPEKSLSRVIGLADNYASYADPVMAQQFYDNWRLNEAAARKENRRRKQQYPTINKYSPNASGKQP